MEKSVRVRLLADVQQWRQGMAQAKGDVTSLSRTVATESASSSRNLQQMGGTLTRSVTLPLALAGAAAVKLSADFDTSFRRMQGLAGVAADEVEGLKESVLDLAGETAQSPQKLAEALYFVRSAGLDGSAAMETLEVSAKGAAVGLGEAAAVADLVTSAIGAYGEANLTAAQAGDILVATAREGKAEAAALAPQMGRLLPIASELGVTFGEVGGALAYLTRSGGGAELASTNLGNVLQKLLTPAQEGVTALQELGLTTDDIRASISERGLLGTLVWLREELEAGGMELGDFSRDAQFTTGMLALTADAGERAAPVIGSVTDAVGDLDEAMESAATGPGFKMRQALADVQVALIRLGDIAIPIAADIAGFVSDIAQAFSALPDPVQKALVLMLGMGAAVGPIMKVVGGLRQLSSMGAVGAKLATGLGALGGVVALAGIAWFGYSQRQEEAKARAQEFTDAVLDQTGALQDNINAVIARRFADNGLVMGAERVGASLDALANIVKDTDGVEFDGLRDSLIQLQGGMLDVEITGGRMSEILDRAGISATPLGEQLQIVGDSGEFTGRMMLDLLSSLGLLNEDFMRGSREAEELAGAQDALGTDTASTTREIERQEAQTRELTEAMQEMNEAVQSSLSNSLSHQEAILASSEALLHYHEVLADGEATADDRTQAGIDLLQAYLAEGEAAKEAAETQETAAGNAAGAQAAGVAAQIASLSSLASTLEPGSDLRVQLDGFIAALVGMPQTVTTYVNVEITTAQRRVAELQRSLQGLANSGMIVTARPGAPVRSATGGVVPGSGVGDIVPALLEPGEFVVRKRAAQALGYDTLFRLNRYATGGIVGSAGASMQTYDAAIDQLARTPAGRSVTADLDANEARRALEGLLSTYRELIATVGVAAADQLLWMSQSADHFDHLSDFAKEAADRLDVMFDVGDLGTDEYLSILRERLAGTEQYSDEWYSIWQKIMSIEEDRVNEERRIQDSLHEIGMTSNADWMGILQERLAGTEQFSAEWFDLWKQINQITQDAADEQRRILGEIRDAQRSLTDSAISDLSSVYQAARDEAAETGEGFEAVLARHLAAWRAGIAETQAAEAWAAQYAAGLRPSTLASLYPGGAQAMGDANLAQFLASPYVQSYDAGGWLQPGWTMAYNGTGAPERVGNDGGQLFGDVYVAETADVTSMFQRAAIARKSKRL